MCIFSLINKGASKLFYRTSAGALNGEGTNSWTTGLSLSDGSRVTDLFFCLFGNVLDKTGVDYWLATA